MQSRFFCFLPVYPVIPHSCPTTSTALANPPAVCAFGLLMADPLQPSVIDGEGGGGGGERSFESATENVFHRPGPAGANEGEAGGDWLRGVGDGVGVP